MKVIATKPGCCGLKVREPGEAFEIPDHLFSPEWMVRDLPPAPAPRAPWFHQLIAFLLRDIRSFF